ncbi:hypothetical protein MNQ98_21355 [Paenibacillus sp. N3/727]|uniref:hypothetical protein n=1 Tax=Paenibacillus sp. N3/727 TaxID=2925845 RepID=UPI001F52DCBC|nr:hypothetical protein [Paenibacillus sp. N3/727]UNK17014.1 hypothetical protein MNQ98_21355 [Paenibacillus sp. N3/727]
MVDKYIGEIVEIIYEDRKGKITQRKIEVMGVKDGHIRATCLSSDAPRVLLSENILAMKPIGGGSNAAS